MAGGLPVKCPPAQRSFILDFCALCVTGSENNLLFFSFSLKIYVYLLSCFFGLWDCLFSFVVGFEYNSESWDSSYSWSTGREGWIKFTGIICQILIINKEACLCLFQLCYCMKMSRLANNWDLAAAAACVFTSLLISFGPTAAVMLVLSG